MVVVLPENTPRCACCGPARMNVKAEVHVQECYRGSSVLKTNVKQVGPTKTRCEASQSHERTLALSRSCARESQQMEHRPPGQGELSRGSWPRCRRSVRRTKMERSGRAAG